MPRLPASFITIAPFAGTVAFILLFWTSAYGPGVSPDSIIYLETAVSVASGEGFYANGEPMTHYPPAYPLLLAVGSLMGPNILATSRVLHAAFFGMNAALVATAVHFLSNRRQLLTAASAFVLFMISAPILSAHAMAWSDPPFVMFFIAGLFLLSLHLTSASWLALIAAALVVGLGMTTRYIGVTMLVPLLFSFLVLDKRDVKERGGAALVATTVAFMPIGLWFLRNLTVAHTAANRQFAIHPFGPTHVKALISTLSDFVLPVSLPFWAKAVHMIMWLILLLVALKAFYRSNGSDEAANQAGRLFVSLNLVFIISYLTFLVISISFLDAYTPLDNRILLPVFTSFLMVTVLVAATVLPRQRQPAIRLTVFFFMALSLSLNSFYVVQEAQRIHREGLGYTSLAWRNSETITAVGNLDSDIRIYSNGPDVLRFWTGKDAQILPYRVFPTTLRPNEEYTAQSLEVCLAVANAGVYVVYFDKIDRRYLLTQKDLTSVCGEMRHQKLEDGIIYGRYFQSNLQ